MLRRLHSLTSSLKARLAVAGLLLIAFSVSLTVVLVLRSVEQRTQRAALDSEIANVERIGEVLSAKLVSQQNAMRAASLQLPVARIADVRAIAAYLDSQRVLRSQFDTVYVAGPGGDIVALADSAGARAVRIDVRDREYVKRTLDERRPVISRAVVSRTNGVAMFLMTMPVFARDGRLAALLVCGMRLDTNVMLSDLTRPAVDDHDPVTTIVTDAAGHIVSHPDPAWLMRDASDDPRFAGAVAQWKRENAPVEPQGSARRLGDDIVAVAGVPDADWVVFRSAPAEVLLGGPTAGRRQAVWIGAAVAIAGGLVILAVMFTLLRPLRQLERRALRLLSDDIAPEDGWPRGGGELGELARVFRHVMKQQAAIRRSGDELFGQMHAVMMNAPVGIAFTRQGRFELVSEQFCRMFGIEAAEMTGRTARIAGHTGKQHRALESRVAATFTAGRPFDSEFELLRADGSRFWARMQGAPVRTADVDAGTIWIVSDVTESRSHRDHLSWTASHDELTGLVNRREFDLRLAEQIEARAGVEPAAALFIDLDRFKAVNDSAGHAAGDALLKDVSRILDARARPQDTVARFGGDEFAVLLRGCGPSAAERVAAELCARVADYHLEWEGRIMRVSASIGVVAIDASFADVDAVLRAADAACYAAKRAGRGAVRVHRGSVGGAASAVEGQATAA